MTAAQAPAGTSPSRDEAAARRAILPHRSYRTLPSTATGAFAALACTVLVELALALYFAPLARTLTRADASVLQRMGFPVGLESTAFLGKALTALTFTMPVHRYLELVLWILACLAGIVVFTVLKSPPAPLRYFVNFNLLIVCSEATYLLFAGHLGYSARGFSVLMLRTMIVTWFVIPAFVGAMVALFPFRAWETAAVIVVCVGYDFLLEGVRYAAFAALLTHTGPILMSDLFLLYGPLLDIIPIIGIFAIALAYLSRRMQTSVGAWEWL